MSGEGVVPRPILYARHYATTLRRAHFHFHARASQNVGAQREESVTFAARPIGRRDLTVLQADWQPRAAVVCVPVRDERDLLPLLLKALAGQQSLPCPVTISLLFDGCRDGSEAVVRTLATSMPFEIVTGSIPAAASPNAGRARRAALALGLQAIGDTGEAALLTTDADSIPAAGWIAAACRGLAIADVVAGRIVRQADHRDRFQDRIEVYYDRLYALRRTIDPLPWEGGPLHHHTGGANLAFRASAYHALGGFAELCSGEDAAIVDAAHRSGMRVRRDGAVIVETSSRRTGRAIGGLADHLRRLGESAERDADFGHPEDAVWQYRGHAAARAAFATLDHAAAERLAEYLAVTLDHVSRVAASASNAEAFATHVVPSAPSGGRRVTLSEAEQALDLLEMDLLEVAA